MRRFVLIALLTAAMIATCLVPATRNSSAAAGVKVGDYWTYKSSADLEGMSATITEKMKVTGTEGSGSTEVYVITLSGSGSVSGSISGTSVSGKADISGEIKRLKSNFSMVSSDQQMSISMKVQGQSGTVTEAISGTCSPALDDFTGDNGLGHGDTLVSRSTATTTVTMNVEMGGNSIPFSQTATNNVSETIQIGTSNQTVTVEAGTFDCYVCTFTLDVDGQSNTMTYYYSAEVGNYVKMEGTIGTSSFPMGLFGAGELTAFSYGGRSAGASSSILSGSNLMMIVVALVIVVVAVSLLVVLRRRGRSAVHLDFPQAGSGMPAAPGVPPVDTGVPPPPPTLPPPTGPGPGS